jgi:hypothetical protein
MLFELLSSYASDEDYLAGTRSLGHHFGFHNTTLTYLQTSIPRNLAHAL